MKPTKGGKATLDDLLERLLDRGVVLNLDLIIGIADIPLIGINLRAAIAAIETMLDYGMMNVWDERIRAYAEERLSTKVPQLGEGEAVILEVRGSYLYSDGVYEAWRPVHVMLSNRRLVLFRKHPVEIIWEARHPEIVDARTCERASRTHGPELVIEVRTKDGRELLLKSAKLGDILGGLDACRQGGA